MYGSWLGFFPFPSFLCFFSLLHIVPCSSVDLVTTDPVRDVVSVVTIGRWVAKMRKRETEIALVPNKWFTSRIRSTQCVPKLPNKNSFDIYSIYSSWHYPTPTYTCDSHGFLIVVLLELISLGRPWRRSRTPSPKKLHYLQCRLSLFSSIWPPSFMPPTHTLISPAGISPLFPRPSNPPLHPHFLATFHTVDQLLPCYICLLLLSLGLYIVISLRVSTPKTNRALDLDPNHVSYPLLTLHSSSIPRIDHPLIRAHTLLASFHHVFVPSLCPSTRISPTAYLSSFYIHPQLSFYTCLTLVVFSSHRPITSGGVLFCCSVLVFLLSLRYRLFFFAIFFFLTFSSCAYMVFFLRIRLVRYESYNVLCELLNFIYDRLLSGLKAWDEE